MLLEKDTSLRKNRIAMPKYMKILESLDRTMQEIHRSTEYKKLVSIKDKGRLEYRLQLAVSNVNLLEKILDLAPSLVRRKLAFWKIPELS